MAVRKTSTHFAGPAERASMSSTGRFLRSRIWTAASMESSSKGFMECLTPWVSTAVRALFTRGLTCRGRGVSGIVERMKGRAVEKGGRRRCTYGIVDDPFDGY